MLSITPQALRRLSRAFAFAILLLPGSVLRAQAPIEDLVEQLKTMDIETQPIEFHQYSGVRFEWQGIPAQIVAPESWAAGKPWIWRARFWGHQPALDLALLKRGYGLAYCDVQNLYGAPEAVSRWDTFYKLTQQLKWNAKPILEGMSRGGLIIFNWAKANPDQVSAIYGDNPVCDIRSWPAKRSPSDWRRCFDAYGLKESEVDSFKGNPFDELQPLADAGVPIFLVLGEDDEVVPIEENGLELARRYQSLGGSVSKWVKPDQGHHPHGLDPVTPLLNELIALTPRPEAKTLPLELLQDSHRILILGDSITYGGEYVSHFATWAKQTHGIPTERFINLGVPSETVSGLSEDGHAGGRFPRPDLHERLTRALDSIKPDLIFACYGINCGIYQPFDVERLAAYQAGLEKLNAACEQRGIKIVFLTPPIYDSSKKPDQQEYEGVMHSYANWLLAQQQTQNWRVIDVHYAMKEALDAKRISDPTYTLQPDGVHPSAVGHQIMAAAMINAFSTELDAANAQNFFADADHESLFAKVHKELKSRQRASLEATQHRRPGVPGYTPQ